MKYVTLHSVKDIADSLDKMGEARAADFVRTCHDVFDAAEPKGPKCSNCQHPIDITCKFCYGRPVYDKTFGDDRVCKCSHPYYRHYDGYDDNAPVGCKYCHCPTFEEALRPEDIIENCSCRGGKDAHCDVHGEFPVPLSED
jgi:hypothetical protein